MFNMPVTEDQVKAVENAIDSVKELRGITVELTGLWVWISGDTKQHKDTLKALGYKWACKRKMWYFAGVKSSGRGKDMNYVRAKYGSAIIASNTAE